MNTIKNTIIATIGCISSLPLIAHADSGFIPRASYAISEYSFTQDPRPGILNPALTGGITEFPELSFDVTFNILGVGGTFYKDVYYIDLSAQHSDNQSDDFVFGTFQERFKGDRKDYALTVGMKILDFRGSVYAGYKVGQSEASGTAGTDLKFTEDGFFVGGNYGWSFDAGTLTLNLAVAFLDGELKESAGAEFQGFSAIPSLDVNADSEATGVSYGVSWSGPISGRWSYSLSLDANNYTFDKVKDNDTVSLPDELEEEFISARATISYNF